MTKIDLITGILGSGKTTFLRIYAKHLISQGKRIAILENDFGAVNVDMLMLRDLKCNNCQIEMVAGGGDPDCHKRRFKTQLISLGMQHFDRVIVEPSGIFDMDEFFDTLHESPLDRWFEVGSVLTIIDAEMKDVLSDQMEYLLASEAACCGKLILSKLSSVRNEPIIELSKRIIEHLNRSLSMIKCDRSFKPDDIFIKDWNSFTEQDYDSFLSAGYRGSCYVKLFSADSIQSAVHYFMHIRIPEKMINTVINNIMSDPECGRIFRIKGSLLSDSEGWLKINATNEKIEISPVPDGQAVLIVIGDDIKLEIIDRYFKAVNTDPEYVSI